MTSSGPGNYPQGVGAESHMSLVIADGLATATGRPAQPRNEESGHRLNISVVFTSVESTLAALREAGGLATSLGARITLLVPQLVPNPLPLESPPIPVEFNEKRFRIIAGQSPVETEVHIYLCRDRFQMLKSVLAPGSIVILGGRKRRWWRTPDGSARKRAGVGRLRSDFQANGVTRCSICSTSP